MTLLRDRSQTDSNDGGGGRSQLQPFLCCQPVAEPEIVVAYLKQPAGEEIRACSVNYAVYFPFFQFFDSGI